MMRYTYRPLDEAREARRKAAMDFLGAVFLAMSIAVPMAFFFILEFAP
jgi:hypothetical protein